MTPGPLASLCQQDAVAWLGSLPDACVDLLITDPPYESLEKHRAVGTTTRLKHSKASSNDWFRIFPNSRFESFLQEAHRVLKKDRHFYLFCDQETLFVVKPIAESVGFKFWKPLIWDKVKLGMGYHYRARYELILFFEKGKRRLADWSIPDILSAPRVHRGYPTQKPVSLAEILIRQSTEPEEVVADPFMGSGTTGVAAALHGRNFLGNDIEPHAVDMSRTRLQEVGAQIQASRAPLLLPPVAAQLGLQLPKTSKLGAGAQPGPAPETPSTAKKAATKQKTRPASGANAPKKKTLPANKRAPGANR